LIECAATRAVPVILQQHVEDAAILYATRTALTRAPHVRLLHLGRFDARLEAHLDGVAVAREDAWPVLQQSLELPSTGRIFTFAVRAIESREPGHLDRLFALAEALPEVRTGLVAAFGWMEAPRLRGLVVELLNAPSAFRRSVGVAASALHRVDPGLASGCGIEDEDGTVRSRAWRAAGELGKAELLPRALNALEDDGPACRFWAAWSAVLLGSGERGLGVLADVAREPGRYRARAFQLVVQTQNVVTSHAWLNGIAPEPLLLRWLIRGTGLIGDPRYVPWLINHMADITLARLAGESFSLITGLDLAWLDLERKPPEDFESGPNDDPNDPNVEMDEDEGLPWPDQNLIQAWWQANSHRFQAGVRYFMGEPLNRENCLRVLREGFQRQRICAAIYLSLLNPGTPLFEWRAPARRQERILAQMG
jgi:uncharacterized protein (TIGR02270 family)